jgi:citrate synthase
MSSGPFTKAELWPTAITAFNTDDILIRGRNVVDLMETGDFGSVAFLLLTGRQATPGEAAVWNAIMIASSDHGPTSPSTFAARVIASGNRRAPEAAVGGGILAIGDAHGGAGEEAMAFLQDGLSLVGQQGSTLRLAAEDIVRRYRSIGRRMAGLGHRFHAVDPRTERLWSLSESFGLSGDGIALMREIANVLSETVGRPMPVNVDGAIAAALIDMGLTPPVARMVFILGRAAGISAHVLEELAREKPMRFRFDFHYDGPVMEPGSAGKKEG